MADQLKDGILCVYCPAGFAYNPVVNKVRCYLNGVNVSAATATLMSARLKGDAFDEDESDMVRVNNVGDSMLIAGAESFGVEDLCVCLEDFLKMPVEAMLTYTESDIVYDQYPE